MKKRTKKGVTPRNVTVTAVAKKLEFKSWIPRDQRPPGRYGNTDLNILLRQEDPVSQLLNYFELTGDGIYVPIEHRVVRLSVFVQGKLSTKLPFVVEFTAIPGFVINNDVPELTLEIYEKHKDRERFLDGTNFNFQSVIGIKEGDVYKTIAPFSYVKGVLSNGYHSVTAEKFAKDLVHGDALQKLVIRKGWKPYVDSIVGKIPEDPYNQWGQPDVLGAV